MSKLGIAVLVLLTAACGDTRIYYDAGEPNAFAGASEPVAAGSGSDAVEPVEADVPMQAGAQVVAAGSAAGQAGAGGSAVPIAAVIAGASGSAGTVANGGKGGAGGAAAGSGTAGSAGSAAQTETVLCTLNWRFTGFTYHDTLEVLAGFSGVEDPKFSPGPVMSLNARVEGDPSGAPPFVREVSCTPETCVGVEALIRHSGAIQASLRLDDLDHGVGGVYMTSDPALCAFDARDRITSYALRASLSQREIRVSAEVTGVRIAPERQ